MSLNDVAVEVSPPLFRDTDAGVGGQRDHQLKVRV